MDTAVTTAPCQLEATAEHTSKPLQVVNSDVNLSHESNAVDNVETMHEDEENASPTLTEGNRIEHLPESAEFTTIAEKCLKSTNDVASTISLISCLLGYSNSKTTWNVCITLAHFWKSISRRHVHPLLV